MKSLAVVATTANLVVPVAVTDLVLKTRTSPTAALVPNKVPSKMSAPEPELFPAETKSWVPLPATPVLHQRQPASEAVFSHACPQSALAIVKERSPVPREAVGSRASQSVGKNLRLASF